MALLLQQTAQLAVVVNLAVEDHVDAAVLVCDGLVAGIEIDDAEPPHRQPGVVIAVVSGRIGSTVDHRVAHRQQISLADRTHHAADAAHAVWLPGTETGEHSREPWTNDRI